jgi:peptidoglycan/LPS O-acetylase OafA/YrhL
MGLRALLLLVAVVLFVIAVFSDEHYADLLAWGLAAFAASFVADDLAGQARRRRLAGATIRSPVALGGELAVPCTRNPL